MPSETKISFSDGGSTDTLRKYSDDYSRKHLADLVEADEESEYSGGFLDRSGRSHRKASSSSSHSVTSMDALWEKHPRKLSEAGLRRSSDHSVVLTEDTDSFIIGDRVWVGGSKPGQIAYIGETQFAPGDWAGIVLDDPIGKNDGSVAGVRYFQCAERRGVFSRLTRLTRAPLTRASPTRSQHGASPASDAGSISASVATPLSAARRALSPNGSVRSGVSSRMNTSVSSTNGALRLGERVIVSSSQGSKAGVLRYCGPADFASGVWCGVELDDPIGRNDGSVEGKRYFTCAPRFGLFAPLSKVSLSPSRRRPGACAVHRRSGSRESLVSLGTSLASSVRTDLTARRPGLQVGPPSVRSEDAAHYRHTAGCVRPRRHRSAPPFSSSTLLVERFEMDRCKVIAVPAPGAFYELVLPGEARAARRTRRHTSEVSRGGGAGVVCWRGRPAAVLAGGAGRGDLYVRLSPPQYFANLGRSYHYSCVSPFQFNFPNVVYI